MADFGLARSLTALKKADEGASVLTDYVATRWYRAPEILLGSTCYTKVSPNSNPNPKPNSNPNPKPDPDPNPDPNPNPDPDPNPNPNRFQAVDMWAVGCIIAEMFVGKPLLPGSSTMNQLECVLEVTGPPNAADIAAIKSQFAATMLGSLAERPKMDLKRAMKGAPDEAVDLVERLMYFNPDKRPDVEQAHT